MPPTNPLLPTVITNSYANFYTNFNADFMVQTSDIIDQLAWIKNHLCACQQPCHPTMLTKPIDTNNVTPVSSQALNIHLVQCGKSSHPTFCTTPPQSSSTPCHMMPQSAMSKVQIMTPANKPVNCNQQAHVMTHNKTEHVETILVLPNGTTTPVNLIPSQPAGTLEHVHTPPASEPHPLPQQTAPPCGNTHTLHQTAPIDQCLPNGASNICCIDTKDLHAHCKMIDDLLCTTTSRTDTCVEFALLLSHNSTTQLTPFQGTHLWNQVFKFSVLAPIYHKILFHTLQLWLNSTIQCQHVHFCLCLVPNDIPQNCLTKSTPTNAHPAMQHNHMHPLLAPTHSHTTE